MLWKSPKLGLAESEMFEGLIWRTECENYFRAVSGGVARPRNSSLFKLAQKEICFQNFFIFILKKSSISSIQIVTIIITL